MSYFNEFDDVIRPSIENYIPDRMKSEKTIDEIRAIRENRVLIEVDPEWVKAQKVPVQ